jgi:hypothetical protein
MTDHDDYDRNDFIMDVGKAVDKALRRGWQANDIVLNLMLVATPLLEREFQDRAKGSDR